MKVGGAALGLTAIDLLDAAVGLAMIGNQDQINRHALAALA
jgi:hypothetical protein